TREELHALLWPDDTFVDFDHGLNVAINKIRDALGDEAVRPRFVETVPRRGYRFIAPVERFASRPSAPVAEPATTAPVAVPGPSAPIAEPDRRAGWARSIPGISGVAALVVVMLVGFATRATWWPTPSAHVIAVLPLRNLSPEAGTDYFTDGLTD